MRGRKGRPQASSNDWLMQNLASKIQQMQAGNVPPAPEQKEKWWQTGLKKVVAPIAIQALARHGAKQFEPEGGGGYPGVEGSIARAMKSKAKAIEDEANLKQEISERKKQQYNERNTQIINALVNLKKMKTELGQQTWERGFREKQLAQQAEIAGMRVEPTKFELEKQKLELGKIEAQTKKINAGTAKIYADMKAAKDPKAEMFDIPKQYQAYYTQAASDVYADLDDAYKKAVAGDRTVFDTVKREIDTRKEEMASVKKNIYGETVTDRKDYSNLISLWSWMDTQLSSAGLESTQEADMAEMVKLFTAEDYDASEKIAIRYGLSKEQYIGYVRPAKSVKGGAVGGFLGSR